MNLLQRRYLELMKKAELVDNHKEAKSLINEATRIKEQMSKGK